MYLSIFATWNNSKYVSPLIHSCKTNSWVLWSSTCVFRTVQVNYVCSTWCLIYVGISCWWLFVRVPSFILIKKSIINRQSRYINVFCVVPQLSKATGGNGMFNLHMVLPFNIGRSKVLTYWHKEQNAKCSHKL